MVSLESWQHFQELGNLAIARGLHDIAIEEYTRALLVAQKTADQSAQAETLRAMAKTYLDLNSVSEAKQKITEAQELDFAFWGQESKVVAEDMFLLAEVLRREGNLSSAHQLYERVLTIRKMFSGAIHDETLEVLLRLIWVALEEGRQDELVKLTYQASDIFKQLHPDGMFGKLLNLKQLLQPYMIQGRYVEAELIIKRTLQILRTVLGDRNSDSAEVMSDCSEVMKMANKHLSAWHLASRSQAMDEINSLERQADTFMHTGNLDEAEIALRRLLANLQRRTASDKILVSRVLRKYADVVFKLGRATDAELLKRQALNWESRDKLSDVPSDLLFWF